MQCTYIIQNMAVEPEYGVWRVVEGVAGDERAAVHVAREDELDLCDPLLDGLRLGLRPLVVLLEVVGEVPVQVEPARVVPEQVDPLRS